jgi:CDP-glycerol glycerophosphotransferase
VADGAFSFAQGNLAKLYALPKYAFSMPLSWFVPRSKRRWVFGSGAGFGEGALVLAHELQRSEPEARICWLTADEAEATLARAAGFATASRTGPHGFWETLRARTVVVTHGLGDANRFGLFGASVVQLWHGAPLKRLHLDSAVTTQLKAPAPFRALIRRMYRIGSDRISLFVTGSETAAGRIGSAFQIGADRVHVLGDPRDDALAAQAIDPARALSARAKIRCLLGLSGNPALAPTEQDPALRKQPGRPEPLVLYAPTWRDGDADPAVPTATEAASIHAWVNARGARLVLRSHPLGAGAYAAVLGGRVSELSAAIVSDITPLLGAFDAVITDYSSIAIDYALLGRPIFWFAPDLRAYEASRGLYEPLETTSGGRVLPNWESVLEQLASVFPVSEITTAGERGSAAYEAAVANTRTLAARFHAYPNGGSAARVLAAIHELPPASGRRSTRAMPSGAGDPSECSIFFESFYGRQVSCNPLALDAEIARRLPQARRFWSVTREDQIVPPGATAVLEGSPEWHRVRRESVLLVVNDWLRRGFRRRRGQTVLQTWHGTMLKHLALGRPAVSLRTRFAIRRESRRWTIMLSQNPHSSAQFRSSYAFHGVILETGYPRDDRLARAISVTGSEHSGRECSAHTDREYRARKHPGRDPVVIREARDALGLPVTAKVLAYVPTWRDSGSGAVDGLDAARLAAELGPLWVVVARGHTRTRELGGFKGVVDASGHPDVNDVILAADLLVTDYSSIMFDASVARVPQVFFVPDLVRYRDRERGFTFDFESQAPGPLVTERTDIVRLATELMRNGTSADWVRAAEPRAAAWRARFNPHDDGRASERVVTELQRRGILPG